MLKLQSLMALWYIRILAFIVFWFLLNFVFGGLTGNMLSPIVLFLSSVFASAGVEACRKNSRVHLFGLTITQKMPQEFFYGLVLTLLNMLFIGVFAFGFSDSLSLAFHAREDYFLLLITTFLLAFFEELVFRGVVFQAVLDYFGKYITVFLISLLFAAAHFVNVELSGIFFLNLFLAGVLFSVMYLKTQTLWLSIAFHLFWNFFIQVLLGSPVSGYAPSITYVNFGIVDLPEVLFGGNYGVEGGLLTTVVMLTNIWLVLKYFEPSPRVSAMIYKRYYAESALLYNRDKKINKG